MHLSAQKILDFGNAILNNKVFDMESDTMRPPNTSGFIVVECQTAPNDNNKCVCVPRSWVQCEVNEKKVAIVYPAEDESLIITRIANNEPASEAWSLYIGEIKYEAESYEDAVVGFLEQNVQQIEDKSCKIPEPHEEAAAGVVEETVKQVEEKSCEKSNEDAVVGLLEKNINRIEEEGCIIEPRAIPKDSLKLRIVVPKLNLKKKKKSLKKHLREQSKDKIHKSKSKNEEKQSLKDTPRKKKESTSDSGDSGVAEGSTGSETKPNGQNDAQTSEKSLESKIEDLIIESLQQSLKEININNPDKSRRTISECVDIEQDIEIDLSNSNLTPKDRLTVATLLINQKDTREYIKAVLVHMKTLYIKYIEEKKTLDALVLKLKGQTPATAATEKTQPNEHAFEEEGSISDDMETLHFDDKIDSDDDADKPNITEQKDNTSMDTELQDLLEETDTAMESESDFETFIDDEESSLSPLPSLPPSPEPAEPVKPKRRNSKSYRYEENSTWSLKHSQPGDGLVPFGRSNQVYISVKGFEKVKEQSTDIKMLARSLFKEIFTKLALRTCTMTGRSTYCGKNTEFIRPPLHSDALNDIIDYSMSYGVQKGWNESKYKLIRSLGSFLQNSRRALKKR